MRDPLLIRLKTCSWSAFTLTAARRVELSVCAEQSGEGATPIMRRSRADIDRVKLLANLAASRVRTEEEIEAEAAEDGNAWTEEELATAVVGPYAADGGAGTGAQGTAGSQPGAVRPTVRGHRRHRAAV